MPLPKPRPAIAQATNQQSSISDLRPASDDGFLRRLQNFRVRYAEQPRNKRLQTMLAKNEYLNSIMLGNQKNYHEAIESAQRCIDVLEAYYIDRRPWWKHHFICSMIKAHWYNAAGDTTRAKQTIEQALTKVNEKQRQNAVFLFRACEEQSQIEYLSGQFDSALHTQKDCVALLDGQVTQRPMFAKAQAYAYHTLANRYASVHQIAPAKENFNKAIELWRLQLSRETDANAMINLSDALADYAQFAINNGDTVMSSRTTCEMVKEANDLSQKASALNDPFVYRQYTSVSLNQLNRQPNTSCQSPVG